MSLVSVVIPNYNYARWVGAAVESVLAQTYSHKEVIVIDNGSTDDSLAVLARFGNRIRVIAQDNRGQAGSRNRGIEESKGEFVAFLDADDVWLPEKLAKQMPLFSDPKVGLVYCGMRRVDQELRPLEELIPSLAGDVLEHFALHPSAVVQGGESTAVIRKSVLLSAGPFDPNLSIASGWDMWRRIASRCHIGVVSEALVLYRQHSTNASHRHDVFAKDMTLKLKKLFSDPISGRVHHLKRQSHATHFYSFAGALLHSGNPVLALWWLIRSIRQWPAVAGWLLHGAPQQTHTRIRAL